MSSKIYFVVYQEDLVFSGCPPSACLPGGREGTAYQTPLLAACLPGWREGTGVGSSLRHFSHAKTRALWPNYEPTRVPPVRSRAVRRSLSSQQKRSIAPHGSTTNLTGAPPRFLGSPHVLPIPKKKGSPLGEPFLKKSWQRPTFPRY